MGFSEGGAVMRKSVMIACALASAFIPTNASGSDKRNFAEQTVQRHVEAYRSGDIDRFVAIFAKDATVVSNGIVVTGHKQIRASYAANFGPAAPSIDVVESGMVDDRVYLVIAFVFADGTKMCCSYSEYTVVNGKISHLEANF
ncbi:nuclear transport factor 2 family protein [Erythrobacter ani]|uniref:Nuclear transport factor 2 family protein n=1 Tax=Erythrobacter ani TaxID=2827235 RepID=A0ABS6SHY3_9SPHN|nr:nuclear transport factor 2 family protein [Erythrobacter ani]MBV7264626.1 nuclear transport factor 2 family protein [Erythrobacter ani]